MHRKKKLNKQLVKKIYQMVSFHIKRENTGLAQLETKNGRFRATYKGKNVGTFASEEEAEQALKIHIENLKK